ncbi:hypothetical protein E2C01_075885 [Portunus trituberculatus]|uniref:Uncharacterized protein n=1 Tax=Portunus trituberculatus TaxID=210409 RepID=A0A5B7IKJ2_PORTR|nr:hypothetical protein [Portunus trituberculatus]
METNGEGRRSAPKLREIFTRQRQDSDVSNPTPTPRRPHAHGTDESEHEWRNDFVCCVSVLLIDACLFTFCYVGVRVSCGREGVVWA